MASIMAWIVRWISSALKEGGHHSSLDNNLLFFKFPTKGYLDFIQWPVPQHRIVGPVLMTAMQQVNNDLFAAKIKQVSRVEQE